MEYYAIIVVSGIISTNVAMYVRTRYLITNGSVFLCSSRDDLVNENLPTQHINSDVLRKLFDEVSSLREIMSVLQNERVQDTRLQLKQVNKHGWCHAAKENAKRRKQATQPLPFPTRNKFSAVNEVADETQSRKALSCPKVNAVKRKIN
jgi:hypothetical protein